MDMLEGSFPWEVVFDKLEESCRPVGTVLPNVVPILLFERGLARPFWKTPSISKGRSQAGRAGSSVGGRGDPHPPPRKASGSVGGEVVEGFDDGDLAPRAVV